MAKYGSADLRIEIDSTEGGTTLTDITQYIQDDVAAEIEGLFVESHSFGDSWVEHIATGLRKMGEITLAGFYDDAASGPDAIFRHVQDSPADQTRTLRITWGGGKSTTVEVWIKTYRRKAVRDQLHRFEAVLVPTGAVTET